MTAPLEGLTWPLRTDRLQIRPATAADAAATFAFRRLPEVNRWITRAPLHPEDYRIQFADPERLEKTLVIEEHGVVIGDLMLDLQDAWAQAEVTEHAVGTQVELGWVLDPAYGGRGLATEAVRALIELAFAELGVRRVIAQCFADNEPSWRLMERIGMRREAHTVRESLHRDLGWLDGYSYALLAEEWPALRPDYYDN